MTTSPDEASKETEPHSMTEAEIRAWYSDAAQKVEILRLTPEQIEEVRAAKAARQQ